jgi:fused signal recognition particle receptor
MLKFFKKFIAEIKDGPVDWDELEATLIQSDLGLGLTETILTELKDQPLSAGTIQAAAVKVISDLWTKQVRLPAPDPKGFEVWLVAGINGVGKTTSIAKLARWYQKQGHKVHLVGADTFRAAAADQLAIWAQRLGVNSTCGATDSDPGAAIFKGIDAARAEGASLVLVDTSGRLHNKENLMRELGKVERVVTAKTGRTPNQVLVVLDGTNGTNALSQAKEFNRALSGLSGAIVTKLDSSAKGGVVAALKSEMNLDTLWLGSGETLDDLSMFDPKEYAERFF